MCVCARLLLLAALPALAGQWRVAEGEVVSVTPSPSDHEGPHFAPRSRIDIVVAVGQTAELDCKVLRLYDKTVSWVRSRDLQILCHAGYTFAADARVACNVTRERTTESHSLRLEHARVTDSGVYECQVNTEPKMSLFFNLTVIDEPLPRVVVEAGNNGHVHASVGDTATLACGARYAPTPRKLPHPPLQITWTRADDPAAPLTLQSTRGGVSLEAERWSWRVTSRLTLAALRHEDAAVYVCRAGNVSAAVTLAVDDEQHVEVDEPLEAMQRDEANCACTSHTQLSVLLITLIAAAFTV